MNYNDILDVAYIAHPSNAEYVQEYLDSLSPVFTPRAVTGVDLDLEYGRKECVRTCEKEFILLSDADDLYIKDAVIAAVDFLKENPEFSAASCHDWIYVDPNQLTSKLPSYRPIEVSPGLLMGSKHVMHNCVVYRTAAIAEHFESFSINGNPGYNFDMRQKLAFLYDRKRVMNIGLVGVLYRQRTNGNYTSVVG